MSFSRWLLRWIILLPIAGFCAWQSGAVYAQAHEPGQEDRYTFVIIHVPLDEALDELINRTEIDLIFASQLVAGKTAYCNIERARAEEILACILNETSLDYYRQSSGVYVITQTTQKRPRFSTITGIVLDERTNEPLPYASVILEEAETGTATNLEGRFAFSRLKPGTYRVHTSHIAYEEKADAIVISPRDHRHVEIRMTPRTVLSTPIVVNGLQMRLPAETLNAPRVSSAALQDAPALSTPSAIQTLNSVVGVHVGDALADVHVQGGDAGEHQYLLDAAPVFIPIRNGGFFGSFSPFAINQITVHKAGFEARHGSFLAGSIEFDHDLRTADGTLASIQIDPLSLNGRINGSVSREKNISADWMLAGRLGLWHLFNPPQLEQNFRSWSQPNTFLTQALAQDLGTPSGPSPNLADSLLDVSFSDFHAATRIRFGQAKSIYASFYDGRNKFGLGLPPHDRVVLEQEENDKLEQASPGEFYNWFNQMSQVRYEWIQGNRSFLQVGAWTSRYKLSHPFADSPFASLVAGDTLVAAEFFDDFNEIKELGLRTGFDWAAGARHIFSGNLEFVNTESEFSLSIDPFSDSLQIRHVHVKPIRWRIQSFIEDGIALNEKTRLVLGSRFTYIPIQSRLYAEPRLSIRHDMQNGPGGAWAVQLAAGLYRQFYNQFDVASYNSTAILPGFRFWIPINKDTRASSAYHTAANLLFIPNGRWQFNLEGYYKFHPHLTVLDYNARLTQPPINTDPNRFFRAARGYAYGMGVSAAFKDRKFGARATYDYAITRRQILNRFDGRFVPVPWETPHQLFAALDYTFLSRLTVTLRWQSLIGRSWGYRRAYYDYLEPTANSIAIDNLSQPGLHALPAFTQWDLGIAYGQRIGKVGVQGRLNLVNVFDRKNVIDWVIDPQTDGTLNRQERHAIPFFPSFSLRLIY